jgi:hypothetical protein
VSSAARVALGRACYGLIEVITGDGASGWAAGLTRAVALRRDGEVLRSELMASCGFIPMRGAGVVEEQNVWVGGKDGDLLRIDDGRPADTDAAGRALDYPGTVAWTGVRLAMSEILEFWLARMDGFCRVLASRDAVDAGRVESPLFPWGSVMWRLRRTPPGGCSTTPSAWNHAASRNASSEFATR